MRAIDSLADGVRALHRVALDVLPASGLGVVRHNGPEHLELTYVDGLGATAYRVGTNDVPDAFKPRSAELLRLTGGELEANPLGLVESRLLPTRPSGEIRGQFDLRSVATLP